MISWVTNAVFQFLICTSIWIVNTSSRECSQRSISVPALFSCSILESTCTGWNASTVSSWLLVPSRSSITPACLNRICSRNHLMVCRITEEAIASCACPVVVCITNNSFVGIVPLEFGSIRKFTWSIIRTNRCVFFSVWRAWASCGCTNC